MKDRVKENQRTTQKLPVSNSVKTAIKSGADTVQTAAKEAVEHKSGSSEFNPHCIVEGSEEGSNFRREEGKCLAKKFNPDCFQL